MVDKIQVCLLCTESKLKYSFLGFYVVGVVCNLKHSTANYSNADSDKICNDFTFKCINCGTINKPEKKIIPFTCCNCNKNPFFRR